jgi:hypothetical protein
MMFGLALTTTAAYIFFDAGVLAKREPEGYRNWAAKTALRLYTLGLAWFAVTGSWYIFAAVAAAERATLTAGPGLYLTVLTALAPGLPWLLILLQRRRFSTWGAIAVAAAQYGVLALNAVSRQSLQNIELAPFLDPAAAPVSIQWSPMILFLALFVGGLGVVGWMVAQAVRAGRAVDEATPAAGA